MVFNFSFACCCFTNGFHIDNNILSGIIECHVSGLEEAGKEEGVIEMNVFPRSPFALMKLNVVIELISMYCLCTATAL